MISGLFIEIEIFVCVMEGSRCGVSLFSVYCALFSLFLHQIIHLKCKLLQGPLPSVEISFMLLHDYAVEISEL